jgi:hypothetical protein
MSDANTTASSAEDTAGRHRGKASPEEADRLQAPHGRHRRPDKG